MFVLKKMISQFIYPIPFLMLISFVIFGIIMKRKNKRLVEYLILFQILLFAVIAFQPVPKALSTVLEQHYPALKHIPANVTTIVVLGGGSASDPAIPVSSQLSQASLIRLTEGISLYNSLDSAQLIVTGGAVLDTVTIASLQRKMAISLGVDSTRIRMADSALTTEMEALAVKKMVHNEKIILVTSAVHMPRAMALFRKAGIDPIPAPTNYLYRNTPFSPVDLFPSTQNIYNGTAAIHELFGMAWSSLRGRL